MGEGAVVSADFNYESKFNFFFGGGGGRGGGGLE